MILNFLTKWGFKGTEKGQFSNILDIDLDSSNNVYILDSENYRVEKFDSNGNFITEWGSVDSDEDVGNFIYPTDISLDSQNNVYVYSNEIQKFDSNGNFITKFGAEIPGVGQLGYVDSIVMDTHDNLYVTDFDHNYIHKFDSNGNFITKLNLGMIDNDSRSKYSVAVDSVDNVYVVDTKHNQILKFDSNGDLITKWGIEGSGDGEFKSPTGIVLDSADYVLQ